MDEPSRSFHVHRKFQTDAMNEILQRKFYKSSLGVAQDSRELVVGGNVTADSVLSKKAIWLAPHGAPVCETVATIRAPAYQSFRAWATQVVRHIAWGYDGDDNFRALIDAGRAGPEYQFGCIAIAPDRAGFARAFRSRGGFSSAMRVHSVGLFGSFHKESQCVGSLLRTLDDHTATVSGNTMVFSIEGPEENELSWIYQPVFPDLMLLRPLRMFN